MFSLLSFCFMYHRCLCVLFFFFFNDTATTEIYTLSLHDALPISRRRTQPASKTPQARPAAPPPRSEEHTSELQSPCNLVCRLLLEKKKKNHRIHNTTQKKKKNTKITQIKLLH